MSFDDFLKKACPALDLNWSKYRRRSARRRIDRLQPGYPSLELEVLATDIDEASLKRAQRASCSAGTWVLPPLEGFQGFWRRP